MATIVGNVSDWPTKRNGSSEPLADDHHHLGTDRHYEISWSCHVMFSTFGVSWDVLSVVHPRLHEVIAAVNHRRGTVCPQSANAWPLRLKR